MKNLINAAGEVVGAIVILGSWYLITVMLFCL